MGRAWLPCAGSSVFPGRPLQNLERYEECGPEGLTDRTRRPFRYANQLPEQMEAAIVAAKREKPHWGARKIRERLLRRLPHAAKVPVMSENSISMSPLTVWKSPTRPPTVHRGRR